MTNSFQILLVEDAEDTQLIVRALLSPKYQLTICSTAAEASEILQKKVFSLVILDISLPDGNGYTFCTQLRADARHKNVPIIFLTGKSQTQDKVMAFALGADDYIVKPIDPPEFQARVEAKIRRLRESIEEKNVFQKDSFRVLLPQQKIFLITPQGEKDLELSSIEFKLLYFFLRHEDHILSRAQILQEVWGENLHVTDRVVDTCVYAVRKKLGEQSSVIQSIPRIGYRYSTKATTKAA